MRKDKLLPRKRLHILRFRPFSVGLPLVHDVPLSLRAQPRKRREQGGSAAPAGTELRVPLHRLVIVQENPPVAGQLPQPVRNHDPCIRPSNRAVHGPHVRVHAAGRCDLREHALPVSGLPVREIPLKLPGEGHIIHQNISSDAENLRVACPSVPLSRRAVRRDIERIILLRPDRILHEPVEQLIRGVKIKGDRHIGINRNRLDARRAVPDTVANFLQKRLIAGDKRILEAEDGKFRFVAVLSAAEMVVYFLQRRNMLSCHTLNIGLRKFAGRVQHLTEAQVQPLPFCSCHPECDISGNILAEVKDQLSGRRGEKRWPEMLVLRHRNIIRCGPFCLPAAFHCMTAVGRRHACVHNLAVLVVRETDRTVIAPLPGFVCPNDLTPAVAMQQLELHEKSGLRAVLVPKTVCSRRAAEPTVREFKCHLVGALSQQVQDIDRLHLHPVPIICHSRREAEGPDSASIELSLIYATGCGVNPGGHQILRVCLKGFPETVHRIPLFRIHPVISRNPSGCPVVRREQSHFEGGLCTPVSLPVLLVPELHLPENPLPAPERRAVPHHQRHAVGCCLPGVPDHSAV